MQHEQSPSIAKLATALCKSQAEFEGASKKVNNEFFKNKYADLWECISATKDILSKHGLAVIQTFSADDSAIIINTTLAHESGEWVRGSLRMKPKKDDDQGRGSSITYGRRYSYAAIIGLAQKDDDGQAAVEERTSTKQAVEEKPELTKEHPAWPKVVKYYSETGDMIKVRKKYQVSESNTMRIFSEAEDIKLAAQQ